jgi:hypothetical protein
VIPRITVVGEANGASLGAGLPQPKAVDRRAEARADGQRAQGRRPRVARAPALVIHASPPPSPPPLAVTAPAEREISFGHVAGRVRAGDWAVVIRADEKLLAVKRVAGGSFDFVVALPRRDTTVRVSLYGPHWKAARWTATIQHVLGCRGRPTACGRGAHDGALQRTSECRCGGFPVRAASTSRISSAGTARPGNAAGKGSRPSPTLKPRDPRSRALRAQPGKPPPGRTSTRWLRRMLTWSDNDAREPGRVALRRGNARWTGLLHGIGSATDVDGRRVPPRHQRWRRPIPLRVESQPSFPCCKYTTACDLARLLTDVHLAAGGQGR